MTTPIPDDDLGTDPERRKRPAALPPDLEASTAFAARKDQLRVTINDLCIRYGWTHKGRQRIASVTKLLTSDICERRIAFILCHQIPEEYKKFDSVYREKSEYATLKILDHLKIRLKEEGLNVRLATEEKADFGIYDAVIESGTPCRILQNGQQRIRLEIKASLGLPLEQIDRYLWDDSPLMLIRVITGQVVMFRPLEVEEFARFSICSILEKAKRLKNDKAITVPGNYCGACPDQTCAYNKTRPSVSTSQLVKANDSEFAMDITSFFRNLPYVAERTATLVISELRAAQDQTRK